MRNIWKNNEERDLREGNQLLEPAENELKLLFAVMWEEEDKRSQLPMV